METTNEKKPKMVVRDIHHWKMEREREGEEEGKKTITYSQF